MRSGGLKGGVTGYHCASFAGRHKHPACSISPKSVNA